MRWIYNQVIVPNLSYACFVWAHRAEETNYIRHMLERVQKLATLQITGGFVTTPSITLDLLSGLMPIDLKIEFNAVKTAIRIKTDGNWFGQYANKLKGKLTSHAYYLDKKLEKLSSYTEGCTNDVIPKTKTEHIYSVHHQNSDDIMSIINDIPDDDLIIFTDGSLIKKNGNNNHTGAGFTVSKRNEIIFEQSFSLGMYPSINQCELFAINQAAVWINTISPINKCIYIFSDSQITLQKLNSEYTKSKHW